VVAARNGYLDLLFLFFYDLAIEAYVTCSFLFSTVLGFGFIGNPARMPTKISWMDGACVGKSSRTSLDCNFCCLISPFPLLSVEDILRDV